MKIYVAASSKELERAERIMAALRARGHEITFDWTVPIRERAARGEPDAKLSITERGFYAFKDTNGIEDADLFWQLIPTTESAGAWWELGYATGLRNGKVKHPHVIVSGNPERCLFTVLVPYSFAIDAQALAYVLSLNPTTGAEAVP